MKNRPRHYIVCTLFCMTIGLVVMASCNDTKLNSTWTSAPILVDGHALDWNGVTSHFIEESMASVTFANDSSRLFVLMRTRDPRLASVIRRSGLMLWVNAEGKSEKNFVIRYRGGPTREEMLSMSSGEQRLQMDREAQFMTRDTSKSTLTCFVKDRIVEMEIPTDGSTGPAVAFTVDGGFFTYEFSLPLHESGVRSYGLAAVPGQTIRIGAQWGGGGGPRPGDMPERDAGMSGMPSGGGGMGDGGGRGGGKGGGPLKNGSQPIVEQDIQMDLKLAESIGT
jgi:hypothetical protein